MCDVYGDASDIRARYAFLDETSIKAPRVRPWPKRGPSPCNARGCRRHATNHRRRRRTLPVARVRLRRRTPPSSVTDKSARRLRRPTRGTCLKPARPVRQARLGVWERETAREQLACARANVHVPCVHGPWRSASRPGCLPSSCSRSTVDLTADRRHVSLPHAPPTLPVTLLPVIPLVSASGRCRDR